MAKINGVEFTENLDQITNQIEQKVLNWLEEASGEIEAQAVRNSRVDSGQLKGSWKHVVDEANHEATIGSPLENAVWEEFGTGEYAAEGDGRKTPWKYQDRKGKWHTTTGKKPNRTLQRAMESKQKKVQNRLNQLLSEVGK